MERSDIKTLTSWKSNTQKIADCKKPWNIGIFCQKILWTSIIKCNSSESYEIKKKLENLTQKVKEDAKNKDWESRLIDIISIVPSGLINILAEFYMQDSWKKISVLLVFVIVFIMLLFFLRKLVNNYIREKKCEILRYEMEIYFSEREKKKELKNL